MSTSPQRCAPRSAGRENVRVVRSRLASFFSRRSGGEGFFSKRVDCAFRRAELFGEEKSFVIDFAYVIYSTRRRSAPRRPDQKRKGHHHEQRVLLLVGTTKSNRRSPVFFRFRPFERRASERRGRVFRFRGRRASLDRRAFGRFGSGRFDRRSLRRRRVASGDASLSRSRKRRRRRGGLFRNAVRACAWRRRRVPDRLRDVGRVA